MIMSIYLLSDHLVVPSSPFLFSSWVTILYRSRASCFQSQQYTQTVDHHREERPKSVSGKVVEHELVYIDKVWLGGICQVRAVYLHIPGHELEQTRSASCRQATHII